MRDVFALAACAPVLLVGPPGVGKTAAVYAHFSGRVCVMRASSEEDIAGLPYIRDGVEHRTIPAGLDRLWECGQPWCLFIDEVDKMRRECVDSMLTLVESRIIAGRNLPAAARIILAANGPDDGGGDGVGPAMLARVTVVDFIPETSALVAAWRSIYQHPRARAMIDEIARGECPIIDRADAGDSWTLHRYTSPRTLERCLRFADSGIDHATLAAAVSGQVTASAASVLLAAAERVHDEDVPSVVPMPDVLRSASKVRGKLDRDPLRL